MALMDNNIAEAKTHLELAAKSGVQLPGVLNNLAVAIAGDKDGDLQHALTLSNAAIEKLPHPYLFETRGQILCKMERYQECILDLEKGLQAPELASAIYPSLITAYQKLGNQSLADEYAKRLEQIKSKTPEQPSTGSEKADIPAIAPVSDANPTDAEGK
jgi:tetratricopeptide (TPR) repeat protein